MDNINNSKIDVLIVGGGGREHAIAWKISQSPMLGKLYCAPGNGGISKIAECVPIDSMDIEGVKRFALENKIDLVVVAPDDPLAVGMVNCLEEAGIKAFGPVKEAAIIESSKIFSKQLMRKYSIPTADSREFDSSSEALKFLRSNEARYPIVIKADGLAKGKGVIIAESLKEAEGAVKSCMEDKVFGSSGSRIIIEEYLKGQEVTVLTFTDGKTAIPMVSSQDHKRVFDGDRGLNTGGMGAFTPSRIYTSEVEEECIERIIKPTMNALNSEGIKFKGVLYYGLMLTDEGLKVIEYNARFGDPETQVVIPQLKTDLLEIMTAIIDERLSEVKVEWFSTATACIIAASEGYPGKYCTGYPIKGLEEAGNMQGVNIFHSGTIFKDGEYYTAGGRVLGVTATASSLDSAIEKAYNAINEISFNGMHYRRDIGRK